MFTRRAEPSEIQAPNETRRPFKLHPTCGCLISGMRGVIGTLGPSVNSYKRFRDLNIWKKRVRETFEPRSSGASPEARVASEQTNAAVCYFEYSG